MDFERSGPSWLQAFPFSAHLNAYTSEGHSFAASSYPPQQHDHSTTGTVLGEVNDELADLFDDDILAASQVPSMPQSSHFVTTSTAVPFTHPATNLLNVEHKPRSRLKRPSREDWQLRKSNILRWYSKESAPSIVRRLRRNGYHVTYVSNRFTSRPPLLTHLSEKMLRDRLRQWGANVKGRWPSRTTYCVFEPSRAMNANSADRKQRHLLKELDAWYGRAWRFLERDVEVDRPSVYVLDEFVLNADIANDQSDRRAWRRVGMWADKIARMNWSVLASNDLTVLMRSTSYLCHFCVAQQLVTIFKQIITRMICPGHPISLFLDHFCDSRTPPTLDTILSLSAMIESKIVLYEGGDERTKSLLHSRTRIATVLQDLDQHQQAYQLLQQYADDDWIAKTGNKDLLLPSTYHALARTCFMQTNFEKASSFCGRLLDLDAGAALPSTITWTDNLIHCLVRQERYYEAKAVLSDLVKKLQSNKATFASATESERIVADYNLECLLDSSAGYSELEDITSQLRNIRLVEVDEEDEEAPVAWPWLDQANLA